MAKYLRNCNYPVFQNTNIQYDEKNSFLLRKQLLKIALFS